MKQAWYAIMGLTIVLLTISASAQTAKPSPYEGVSQPPASDQILADEDATPTPAAAPSPKLSPSSKPSPAPATSVTVASSTPIPNINNGEPIGNPMPRLTMRPLRPRADSDQQIVTSVLSAPNQLPEGTIVKVLLDQQLSTATTQPGALFSARVMENVSKDGRVVIPMGAKLVGRVLSVSEGRRFRGTASIRLRPDEVDLPNGGKFFLHAEVYDMSSRRSNKTDTEGNIVSKDNGKKTFVEGAISAGGTAVTGAMIAGVPGAIVGAAAGAGIVTAHWLLENHQAVLPKNSEVVFGLTEPMSMIPLHD